jgi:hypothetical protein
VFAPSCRQVHGRTQASRHHDREKNGFSSPRIAFNSDREAGLS